MFPPQIPRVFLQWLTAPGESVYDPFCGRGTAPLEASLMGRAGFGSDANPLAVSLASAKINPPTEADALRRLNALEEAYEPPSVASAPPSISMLYSPRTLAQLIYLRKELAAPAGPCDTLIRAVILGLLHANHSRSGATRGLSVSMPNTFAMSPAYVRRYISTHGLEAPDIDAFQMIRAKLHRLALPAAPPTVRGAAWLADATQAAPPEHLPTLPKLIFTSPPYLSVIKYGKYNWVRLWFLGVDPTDVDRRLMASSSPARYLSFMEDVLARMHETVRDDGYVCMVVGDVRRGDEQLDLASAIWNEVASQSDWRLRGIVADRLPTQHKVSRIWKNDPGRACKTDRILILSPRANDLPLPALGRIQW